MTKDQISQDQQLISLLKLGEPKAVEAWFAQYHDRVLAFVSQKISQPKDAEEIVQEVFVNCLKHLPLFRGQSTIWTWMCGIARHEVADYYRKKYAKKALKTFSLGELLLASPVDDAHETAEKVKKVLKKMTAEYCELLLLKYVDKKQVKEIASELSRTVKAVESDLFRARNEFRALWAVTT